MSPDELDELLNALAVTAELTATDLSKPAAKIMATDLAEFPLPLVLAALSRCRRELKGRLTVAAILERLDDGRPGPNEAWAMIPHDEAASVVWTQEMAESFGIAAPLLAERQVIAARAAFIEAYSAKVALARSRGVAAVWSPSLGFDATQRESALLDAVAKGRLSLAHARSLAPALPVDVHPQIAALAGLIGRTEDAK